MSCAVWKFSYSVEERISALRDVIVQGSRVVASGVRREWSYRAQLVLEPAGWRALYRLDRATCLREGVRYPCVVYVEVDEVTSNEDMVGARVRVVGVQDDSIRLPETVFVQLQHLWPTKAQPNAALEMRPTAEFIDHYRFFYDFVWMPWDLEEDEHDSGGCWFETHVPARCKVWADAYAGRGCPPHALHDLRDDGNIVREHIARIEESFSSDDDNDELDGAVNGHNVSTLMSLHEQLHTIRARWELLQNPVLQNLWNSKGRMNKSQADIITVWNGGPIKSHTEFLSACEKKFKMYEIDANKNTDCSSSLIDTFNTKLKPSSIVLLCEGVHSLPRNFVLCDNYKLSSVVPASECTLKCVDSCTTAIAVGGPAELNELTILPGCSSTGATVRAKTLTLNLCTVAGSSDAQTQAFMVAEGGRVCCNDCIVDGFFTGFVVQKGAEVVLNNCIVKNCGVMLQAYEGAKVFLNGCTFKNCTESAIRYETSADETRTGGANLLNGYKDFSLKNCKFINNQCSDVLITRLDDNAYPDMEGDIAIQI